MNHPQTFVMTHSQAQSTINLLEKKNADLCESLTLLLKMPEYDGSAETSKIRNTAKRKARLALRNSSNLLP